MGKKQGTQTQTIREQQQPYAPAQPGLNMAINELQRIYGSQVPGGVRPMAPSRSQFMTAPGGVFGRAFADRFQSAGDADYNQALARYNTDLAAWQQAQGQGQQIPSMVPEYGLANIGAENLRRTLGGEFLDSNPYIDSIVADVGRDVTGLFAGGSRYGSGAHQDALARAAAGVRFQNYEAERARQMQALGMAPQYDLAPYQLYSARQAAPYEQIRQYLNLQLPLAGAGQSGSQVSQTPVYSNPLLGGLSGAATGAGLGLALQSAGVAAPFPGAGWALAGLGGLAGLLG